MLTPITAGGMFVRMESRFWAKVEPTGFCWEWAAGKFSDGYGAFSLAGKKVKAHRVAWELLMGPSPKGLDPDHLCRNRACVNPDHLEWVTRRENIRRGRIVALSPTRGKCRHGHEYTPENTYVNPRGYRACRTCHRRSVAKSSNRVSA